MFYEHGFKNLEGEHYSAVDYKENKRSVLYSFLYSLWLKEQGSSTFGAFTAMRGNSAMWLEQGRLAQINGDSVYAVC